MQKVLITKSDAVIRWMAAKCENELLRAEVHDNYILLVGKPDTYLNADEPYERIDIIRGEPTPDDIACKRVIGNIPLWLAPQAYQISLVMLDDRPAPDDCKLEDLLTRASLMTVYVTVAKHKDVL